MKRRSAAIFKHSECIIEAMTLLDQIVESPRLPEYVRRLNEILEAERAERERFYEWLPDDKKAEFINGKVFVHSPVKYEHGVASDNVFKLLSVYVIKHELGHVGHEKLLVALTRNDYEPDVCYWGKEKALGFVKGQMKFPAPDLVVEVLSPSTEIHDRETKFEDFAVHGVDEYWIIDPESETIEQYLLTGDHYDLSVKVKDGPVKSRAIRGLEIPAKAVFDGAANLAALGSIMNG
jgi:Uma2 family endonuclease